MKDKISYEQAVEEFDRFAEFARLDMDKPRNESDKSDLLTRKDQLVYYIQKGMVSVDENGHPTLHTFSNELPEVQFDNRPNVTGLRAMDKSNTTNSKLLSMIGSTVGIAPQKLNVLDYDDFDRLSLVFNFFLA